MGSLVVSDNAATTLAASITSDTTLTTLTLVNGSKFPVVNQGGVGTDWSYLSLFDALGNLETVKVTRHDAGSNTFTVVRGAAAGISGQTDAGCRAWASGTTGAACRLVAQTISDLFNAATSAAANAANAAAAAIAAANAANAAAAAASSIDLSGLLSKAGNLADLLDSAAARDNLGLGSAATKTIGVANGQVPTADQIAGLALPSQSGKGGKVLRTDGTSASWDSATVSGTPAPATAGVAIDFTGIPPWVKRVTVLFNAVSTNGSSNVVVRLGSGSVQTTGYSTTATCHVSGAATNGVTDSSGIAMPSQIGASDVLQGHMVLTLISGSTWVCSGSFTLQNTQRSIVVGSVVTLSGTLDRVRITTAGGTDTFDAGSINLIYE